MRTPPGPCRECGQPAAQTMVRRLHLSCYDRVRRAGRLENYPRVTKPMADVLEDHAILTARGCTPAEAAERMGMTRSALEQALVRARRRARRRQSEGVRV